MSTFTISADSTAIAVGQMVPPIQTTLDYWISTNQIAPDFVTKQ